jgi:hypothetical protein
MLSDEPFLLRMIPAKSVGIEACHTVSRTGFCDKSTLSANPCLSLPSTAQTACRFGRTIPMILCYDPINSELLKVLCEEHDTQISIYCIKECLITVLYTSIPWFVKMPWPALGTIHLCLSLCYFSSCL